jgi:hypothetical protein
MPDTSPSKFGYLRFGNSGSFNNPTPNILERDLGWEFEDGMEAPGELASLHPWGILAAW